MVDILRNHSRYSNVFILSSTGFILISLLLVLGCSPHYQQTPENAGKPSLEYEQDIESIAREIFGLITANDIETLTGYIDPEVGLAFSPYGYIDRKNTVLLDNVQLLEAWNENRVFKWGYYDGSGEPITLPIKKYFNEFVYDSNFIGEVDVTVDRMVNRGNTKTNILIEFPKARIVEFHFPGTDPKFAGMDWASLYCVFVPRNSDGWWLVALVHDKWTV